MIDGMERQPINGKRIRTADIARATGVHPNTVRLYEQWGFLPAIPRTPTGHRLYTRAHLEQMRLARIALRCEFVEGDIRKRAIGIIKAAASDDLPGALRLAGEYLRHIQSEYARAEEALLLCQSWAGSMLPGSPCAYRGRTAVSGVIGVSIDVLRNWERNGLIDVPRSLNNYRVYGPVQISRLKIIRTLRSANYSVMAILRMMNHVDKGYTDNIRTVINTPKPEEDIVSATDRWMSSLRETESDAIEVIAQLHRMLQK